MSDKEAASDAALMVVAGSDTVSHALAALFRFIAVNEVVHNRLCAEIQSAFHGSSDIDTLTLTKLPYLDACVQETLRLFPPVATGICIPRSYGINILYLLPGPPRYSGESCIQILDQFVPPRTTVTCPTYSIQRDCKHSCIPTGYFLTSLSLSSLARNFGRPLEFVPERWLPGSAIQPHNTYAFVPFCYGPGVCIGKPVALYNMKCADDFPA